MPVRMRFKPDERETFTAGRAVEVLHGSRWVPAKIEDAVIKTDDSSGGQYMWIKYTGATTRTVSHGQGWRGYPGHVRVAS